MYHLSTPMPGESYRRRLRSLLLCLCDVFRALIISLMCMLIPKKESTCNVFRSAHRCSSSSNWILMSCQPHRVTSGQSNSGHKQIHISKLIPSLCEVSLQNQSLRNIKHTYINIRHNFRRVSPFSITPVKRAHKARVCWYCRPFRLIFRYQVKEGGGGGGGGEQRKKKKKKKATKRNSINV